jgi:hypothetical protein
VSPALLFVAGCVVLAITFAAGWVLRDALRDEGRW